MKKIFAEHHRNVKVDSEKELKELKMWRDRVLEERMITDTVTLLGQAMRDGKRILAEGANAIMLDIDHGTYPYVTSSNTSIGGVCTGLGVPP